MESLQTQMQHVTRENIDIQIISIVSCSLTFKLEALNLVKAPNETALNKQYQDFLTSLDLPPDKLTTLKQIDDKRKWEVLCVRKFVEPRNSPEFYIDKIKEASRNKLVRKLCFGTPVDIRQTLQDLEVALRTYPIGWVSNFLGDRYRALNVLGSYINPLSSNMYSQPSSSDDLLFLVLRCIQNIISCREGMDKVVHHKKLVKKITGNLKNSTNKNKTAILQLLKAICEGQDGHECVINSFTILQEKRRFSILVRIMKGVKTDDVLKIACIDLIYKIVHTPENRNFQVSLQHEFEEIKLGDCLEKILANRDQTVPELVELTEKYIANCVDIETLMEAVEVRDAALMKLREFEIELGYATENVAQVEYDWISRVDENKADLKNLQKECIELKAYLSRLEEEISRTGPDNSGTSKPTEPEVLRNINSESESAGNLTTPKGSKGILKSPKSSHEIASAQASPRFSEKSSTPPSSNKSSSSAVMISARVPPPPPPPIPGMKFGSGTESPDTITNAVPIKQTFQPKVMLPILNWAPLKPNQLKGTIFTKLDDAEISKKINFNDFEGKFVIGLPSSEEIQSPSKRLQKTEFTSLLNQHRLQNVAISLKKFNTKPKVIETALEEYDLALLSMDKIELLQNFIPKEEEIKLYKNYLRENRDVELLSEEDKFLLHLSKIDRLSTKIKIISYMQNFKEQCDMLNLQVYYVVSASLSLKASKKFKTILEIILVIGNYMNSSKAAGPAYGFKMQILNDLSGVKSSDKKTSLLEYIVVNIVAKEFPEALMWTDQLLHIEEASRVSIKNVLHEVAELDKGMQVVTHESQINTTDSLVQFLLESHIRLNKLHVDAKDAEMNYKECVEYFAETVQTIDSNEFFAIIWNFIKNFKSFVSHAEKNPPAIATDADYNSNNGPPN